MNLKIFYPKSASLFLFVSELSQWNSLTCLPKRKKEWIKKTGILSNEDKKELQRFSRILQNSENNFELVFLFGENTEKFPEKEIKEISKILKFFEERFNLIWEEERKKLKIITSIFDFEKNKIVKKYFAIIQKLCGLSENKTPDIILKFLVSSSKEYQGWVYKNTILLECSGWGSYPIEELYLAFLHESFHILIKSNKKIFKQFKNVVKSNSGIINGNKTFKKWGAEVVFEEALISSFIPEGYLGQKIHPKNTRNKKRDALSNLRNFCQKELFDLAENCSNSKKILGEKYFTEVAKSVKKFLEKNKR